MKIKAISICTPLVLILKNVKSIATCWKVPISQEFDKIKFVDVNRGIVYCIQLVQLFL